MFDTWSIQLTITVQLISSKVSEEECMMHSNIDNVEIAINDKEDEVIKGHLQSLLPRYHIRSETSIKS